MNKNKLLKISIAVTIALMLSVGITMAQQMGEPPIEGPRQQGCPCQYENLNPEDLRDNFCPSVGEAGPIWLQMVQQGFFEDYRDGNDSLSPQEIERRITYLMEEWCPGGNDPWWEDGNGFGWNLLTAIAACTGAAIFVLGLPQCAVVAAFVRVGIISGIGIQLIVLAAEAQFMISYGAQIFDAYELCVEILTS